MINFPWKKKEPKPRIKVIIRHLPIIGLHWVCVSYSNQYRYRPLEYYYTDSQEERDNFQSN